MKKIILSGNTAWGMYNFRGKLMEHLVRVGYDVYVSAPYDDVYSPRIEQLGCHFVHIPIDAKGTNPITDLLLIWKYFRLFRKIKPKASITYTIKPNIYASIAARSANISFLPVTTGLGYIFLHNNLVSKIAKALYQFAFNGATKVWFLNVDDMRTFKDSHLVDENKIELLHGEGIDTSHLPFVPLEKDKGDFTFLLIGRMIADKGLYEFEEAARLLKPKYPYANFYLLGPLWKENPAAVSEEQLDSWNKEGNVRWLGATDDVREYIKMTDTVVLSSSYREGIPFTLMEGACMGRPLIATDIPGCRDVVINGKNGFLCEVKNAKSLASAMERILIASHEERQRMGNEGRKLMEEEFDIAHIIEQYDRTLAEMM